jgi:hypothetical protein
MSKYDLNKFCLLSFLEPSLVPIPLPRNEIVKFEAFSFPFFLRIFDHFFEVAVHLRARGFVARHGGCSIPPFLSRGGRYQHTMNR